MGVFQDELEPTLMEIGMSVESDEDVPSTSNSDWDLADRSRITQIAAGSYHSLALSGTLVTLQAISPRVREIIISFCVDVV